MIVMNIKDRKAWEEKTLRLNKGVTIKRGMVVVDVDRHKGVVVKMFTGHDECDHGMVAVWQSERVNYGDDNCEHYPHYGWESLLRITDHNE